MKISGIEWTGIRVPFRTAFATSAGPLAARYCLLIWVETDAGVTGVGEAPAALGLGKRGLEELEAVIRGVAPSLVGVDARKSGPLFRDRVAGCPRAAALRFGFESAVLDAIGRLEGRPLAVLLGGRPGPVAVNALIGATSAPEASDLAAKAIGEGFGAVKLKVGGRPIEQDQASLEAVRRVVGDGIEVRLDANRAWPLAEAASNIRRLAPFRPEYIEEPVTPGGPAALAAIRRLTPVPVAADESVEDRDSARRIIDAGAADVLVIKAARLGGLEESRAIAEMASGKGVRSVVTSSLETGVGLAASVHLAAALDSEEACGLATSSLLEHDLLTTPLSLGEGFIHVPEGPGLGITIDPEALERYGLGLKGRTHG